MAEIGLSNVENCAFKKSRLRFLDERTSVVIMRAERRGHPVSGGALPVQKVPVVQEVPVLTPAP